MVAWREATRASLMLLPVALCFRNHVAGYAFLQGKSMAPTLNPDGNTDVVVFERVSVGMGRFRRGDVYALRSPDCKHTLLKRLIGIEGDTVRPGATPTQTVYVPAGHGWIECDNLGHSWDSNAFGPVPLALIQARALAIVWPPSRIGPVRNATPPTQVVSLAAAS